MLNPVKFGAVAGDTVCFPQPPGALGGGGRTDRGGG